MFSIAEGDQISNKSGINAPGKGLMSSSFCDVRERGTLVQLSLDHCPPLVYLILLYVNLFTFIFNRYSTVSLIFFSQYSDIYFVNFRWFQVSHIRLYSWPNSLPGTGCPGVYHVQLVQQLVPYRRPKCLPCSVDSGGLPCTVGLGGLPYTEAQWCHSWLDLGSWILL